MPGTIVEAFTRHPRGLLLNMGAFSYVSAGSNSPLMVRLTLGRYCSVADGVRIMDGHHPLDAASTSPWHYGLYFSEKNLPRDVLYRGNRKPFSQSYGDIIAGNDVWIGSHCTIMAGITINNGAVIAGGANVTSDVPPYAIVGGNPARVIRYRFDPEICERLNKSAWWDITPEQLRDIDVHNVHKFLITVERLRTTREAIVFSPEKICVQNGNVKLV